MKRIVYIFLAVILGILSAKADENSFIDKYANHDGVTYVNISKTLLQLIPAGEFATEGLLDVSLVIDELERIQILSCDQDDNASLCQKMAKESHIFQQPPYEELMQVKDDDEIVYFYIKPASNQKVKELVMVVNNRSEFVLIRLLGNISINKLQSLTKGMM